MADRSDRVATWLAGLGVGKGDRVILMLGNQVELWEAMLAVAKLGAVIMPTTGALGPADLADRISRGGPAVVIANAADTPEVRRGWWPVTSSASSSAGPSQGWHAYADAYGIDLRRSVRDRAPTSTIRCSSTSPRAPPAGPSWSSTRRSAIRSGTVDDGVDRRAARRRAPGDQFPGLGQARVELLLRAVDRRGDDLRLQLRPVRRGGAAAADPPGGRHHVLRAADGVADADPGRPRRETRRSARDPRRGRTAQPRRHRQGRDRPGG